MGLNFTHFLRSATVCSVVSLSCIIFPAAAQTETGRECIKSEMNLTDLAHYYSLHPETPMRMELEDEDENEARPHHAAITDPSLIHGILPRISGPVTSALLPISPFPTDTFESVYDPGTAIPPDTHGAVDSNYCMTTINTTVKIQTRAGALAIPTVTLNQFFTSVSPANSTFDPRVHYDKAADKWIVVCVDGANNTADSTSILIAISKTGNPTGAWWTYKIRAYIPHDYWLDFPDVGFNGKWITVTGNLFHNSPGGGYNGAKVFVFNKASLLSGAGAPYTSFTHATSFTICPAITYDPAEINMFAVETWDGSASGGGQMELWKITGTVGSEAMTSVGFISATGFNWLNTSYAITGGTASDSDFAPQAGTTNLVRCNDDRVDQMIQMNGRLWFAHTVFLPYSTTTDPSRSSIHWFETDTLANPIQVGLIDDPTGARFRAFPTMAVNTSNDALIGFSTFSGTSYPSAAYAMRLSTDPVDSFRPTQIYRHGPTSYYKTYGGQTNRFGDYSGAVLDPVNDNDFWTIQEASSTTTNDWDTWWAYVKLCSPPDAITGTLNVCTGLTTTLSDDSLGGTWSSGSTGVATVGSTTGIVTGALAGTTIITYTINGGCIAVCTVVVNPLPLGITGPSSVCAASSVTLGDGSASGSWSSSDPSIATVGSSSASVTGIAPGSAIITYTLLTGCLTTSTITVNLTPASITGATAECEGASTTLGDGTAGGTWTSSNTAIATIGTGSANLTGILAGSAIISYTLGSGCYATTTAAINKAPGAITGGTSVCVGYSTTLGDPVLLGTWASSNTSVAPVGGTGIVTGALVGTSIITYTLSDGCYTTTTVNVMLTPVPISGAASVCDGSGTTLSDANLGGTWSTPDVTINIGSSSGIVTTVSVGTAAITYTLGGACMVTSAITVNPSPGPITGITTLCVGFTTNLSDAVPAGAWSSSNTSVATVVAGTVSGTGSGTAIITYDLGAGCYSTVPVTVNSLPTAITGTTTTCSSASTLLGDGVSGGTWSTGNAAIATVGSSSGLVSGVAPGTAIITYSLGVGCFTTTTVTLVSSPVAIAGVTSICVAGTTTLTDGITGGSWTSGNTATATIGSSSGTATGVAIGATIITYALGTGCSITTTLIVTPATAAAITGSSTVCVSQTDALSDATTGGTWTSSNSLIASVGSTSGVVTGVASGTVTIIYTVATPCGTAAASKVITVNPLPTVASISASSLSVCTGATTSLSDVTPFGVWSSSNTAIATVGSSTGAVSGITAGSATVSYSVTNILGCTASALANIAVTTPLAAVITPSGPTTFCTGGNVLLNATSGVGLTYQWMLGSVNIPGATNAGFTTSSGGNFTVSVNSGSGCISVSSPVTVTVNPSPIVVPTDHITAVPGNVLCLVTSPVAFTASSLHGGSSPVYQWFVNGVSVISGTTYTYSPANGDNVKLLLTSNDICAFPDTAVANMTMTISAKETPSVSINANPGATLCTGEVETLTTIPVYGGPSPAYLWSLDGVNVATGPAYIIYTPVNASVIVCTMTSDFACLNTNTAVSSPLTLTVNPPDVNSVNITISQSIIGAGATDTFHATAPFGGSSPAYQWIINGHVIPGATSSVYTTDSLANGEVVYCEFTSSDPCAEPHTVVSGGITAHVGATGLGSVITGDGYSVEPNPNNGAFMLTGTVKNTANNRLEVTVTDMLGQVVYLETLLTTNSSISKQISLPTSVVSGMYLLSITSGADHVIFHIVVAK